MKEETRKGMKEETGEGRGGKDKQEKEMTTTPNLTFHPRLRHPPSCTGVMDRQSVPTRVMS